MWRHGFYDFGSMYAPHSCYHSPGKFSRLFPNLPPFAEDTPAVRQALMDIGATGGVMDPGDDLSDPITSVTDLNLSAKNPNSPNPKMTAGMTFLGQFLDHDITFDQTSSLERQVDPEAITNFRTPMFELDSVYGSGPGTAAHLYDQTVDSGATSFLVEQIPGSDAVSRGGVMREDVPRNAQAVALIADPRNDENLVVNKLHLGFMKFHNRCVEFVKTESPGLSPRAVFAQAQRLTRWHYQWIILNEFLPITIGRNKLEQIRKARKAYSYGVHASMPVEFSVAAYRFGHSQVRPSYRANFGPDDAGQFFAFIFDASLDPTLADPGDLRGRCRAPRRFVDWPTFFDFGDGRVRPNKSIDTKLSTVLFHLVRPGIEALAGDVFSLAQRNLLRHLTFGLPSGQSVARRLGAPILAPGDLADLAPFGMDRSTPLWFYVLREAEIMRFGARLGPVGARIVGEVFLGLLDADPMSFPNVDQQWTPVFGTGGDFKIADLLTEAGLVHPI